MELVFAKNNYIFNHIIDNIYLGDFESSQDYSLLEKNNISCILNVSNENNYKLFKNINYLHIPIEDVSNSKIEDYFDSVLSFLNLNATKNILIHCMNSVSRSVAFVVLYLCVYKNLTIEESIRYINNIRENQYCRPKQIYKTKIKKFIEEINKNYI
jgi:protein-tyrosine phosphatase